MKKKMNTAFGVIVLLMAAVFAIVFTGCPDSGGSNNSGGDPTFTVTFDSGGGTYVAAITGVASGATITKPADPTKTLAPLGAGFYVGAITQPTATFVEWCKDSATGTAWNFATDKVSADTTLYAKWTETAGSTPTPTDISGQSGANLIAKAAAFINTDANGTDAKAYTLVLGENIPAAAAAITLNKANTTLTIKSDGATERTISKGTDSSSIFNVGNNTSSSPSNAKLVIDGSVALVGAGDQDTPSNGPLVVVRFGGSLELSGNAVLRDNFSNGTGGGAVYVNGSADGAATFTMSGNAKITNCTKYVAANSAEGGAVYLNNSYATFTMNGGEISGNTAWSGNSFARGGGVYANDGAKFFFNGGVIKDNMLKYTTYGQGSGVMVAGSTSAAAAALFVMKGGAAVTPKSGGAITDDTLKTDNRNAVSLGRYSSISIDGTLTAATAALLDMAANRDATANALRNWNGTAAADYTSGNAPIGKFTLGKFINTSSPYDVADVADGGTFVTNYQNGATWNANNNGGLTAKTAP